MLKKTHQPGVRQPVLSRDPVMPGSSSGPSSPSRTASVELLAATASARGAGADGRLVIGPNVKLKGAEILDCDTLVVEGRVEATMDSRIVRISETGVFIGKVGVDIAEVRGSFEGELVARSQLIVHATGKVDGKIRYGKLHIEEGGQVSGEIRSLGDEPGEAPPI